MRIDDLSGEPFAAAGLAPSLTAAYDELIGPGRWTPPVAIGDALVVRFPSEDRANAGYHIEGSYPGPGGQSWWANVRSRARGLLALFLLTDVGPDDAPTRLVCGSHLTVARFLAPYGEAGTDADAELVVPIDAVPPRRARDRRSRGRVLVPSVHRAHGDLAAPQNRSTDDRPARRQRAGRVHPGWYRPVAPVPIPLGW